MIPRLIRFDLASIRILLLRTLQMLPSCLQPTRRMFGESRGCHSVLRYLGKGHSVEKTGNMNEGVTVFSDGLSRAGKT